MGDSISGPTYAANCMQYLLLTIMRIKYSAAKTALIRLFDRSIKIKDAPHRRAKIATNT
jgi:hypothetical protein